MAGGEEYSNKSEEAAFMTVALGDRNDEMGWNEMLVCGNLDGQSIRIEIPIERIWKLLGVSIMGGKKLDSICK